MPKRIFDVITSLIGLFITTPIFLIVIILIKLDSKGPVFFKQDRVGKNGKNFKLYKFRTMIKDAETYGPKLTRRQDIRITRFGRFLRWFKIDEIPQFFNVLKNEMSIVGPRPEISLIVNLYSEKERKILSVKPGLIGPNQILGRHETEKYSVNVEDVEDYYIKHILPEKLLIDLEYVKKASLKTDIKYFIEGLKVTILGTFKLGGILENKLKFYTFLGDIFLSGLSYFLAYSLRFDMIIPQKEFFTFIHVLPIFLIVRPIVFIYFRLYQSIWKYTSIKDFFSIFKAVSLSSVIIVLLIYFLDFRFHPRSIPLMDLIILPFLLLGLRMIPRIIHQRRIFKESHQKKNVLIVGAGDEGEFLIREFIKNPNFPYNPIGFIDDDPKKFGMEIHGIKVLGRWYDIPYLARTKNIKEVLIAISKITGTEIKAIIEFCKKANVNYKIVPAVSDLLNGAVHIEKIRNIEVLDLLGRTPVKLDFSAINQFLLGKRILISGAGGSIGGELGYQIKTNHQAELLILVDKTENYLYELECELKNNPSSCKLSFHLCDITHKERLKRIFFAYQPQIVFHAAAHKHVPLGEENPLEVIENNIFGTKMIADLSAEFKVKHFVMISTDKVVNPISIMGVSKRISELYVQGLSTGNYTNYITVRFGNVLNSKGSVIPLFQKQIEQGGPLTITHPKMQRYFMTIQEAVQLILQSTTLEERGKIFILEMGNQIKIVEMANEMIRLTGLKPEEIEIKFIGLRPGEKLSESLVGEKEEVLPSKHPKIKMLKPSSYNFEKLKKDLSEIENLLLANNLIDLKKKLQEIVPTYKSYEKN